MAAIAHSPSFAKKVGVSQSVGKDFNSADKGKTFNKGGMMKKRRFDEGGEIDYEVDENAEPERRSFGSGVSAKNREYNEPVSKPAAKAKPKAKPEAKPAAKKIDADESAYTKAAKASFLGSPGNYLSEPLKRMRERMSNGDQQAFKPRDRGFNKGGMMKESKAMVGKEMAFMKNKGAPKSMMKHEKAEMMGMKKGGMPMKDGKPAFMKKFADGGSIDDGDSKSGGMGPINPRRVPSDEIRGGAKTAMIPANRRNNDSDKLTGGLPAMKKYAKGGGIESHGKTKGTMVRMATGGSVSSASRRADGIAQRGKTRC
jgi:hypothetical protein